MPFLPGSFDLVVSRFAVHHFDDPAAELAEMARVCRPGGRVAIFDMVVAEPERAEDYNHRERLRDPSHTRALTAEELRAELEAELSGGAATAMRPQRRDGELYFTQRWAIAMGRPRPG